MSEEKKEQQEVTVFGTQEVSVKEFMGSTDKSLVVLSDYEKAKQNLIQLKEKHEVRVGELVDKEALTPTELNELNSIRAELREPRYLVQNIEKNNISVFEAYKKTDKANLKELVDINRELEDKASEKIKTEDDRKKSEKEAKQKEEQLRVERIKSSIDKIETDCYEIIQTITFETVEADRESVNKILDSELDFEEYDLLFDQVKERVVKLLNDKVSDVVERENQRLENDRMKQDIFNSRVNRLKLEGYELNDDVFYSKELEHRITKVEVESLFSPAFEAMISNIKTNKEQAEQARRDAELKKQKDEQFEVRKNRLAEIGIIYDETFGFTIADKDLVGMTSKLSKNSVYEASITEFEEILNNAKKSIQEAKEQKQLELIKSRKDKVSELWDLLPPEFPDKDISLMSEEQFSEYIDLMESTVESEKQKQEKESKKKKEQEDKARAKRLASEKDVLRACINDTAFVHPFSKLKNDETILFLSNALESFKAFKSDLLTQLNDL